MDFWQTEPLKILKKKARRPNLAFVSKNGILSESLSGHSRHAPGLHPCRAQLMTKAKQSKVKNI